MHYVSQKNVVIYWPFLGRIAALARCSLLLLNRVAWSVCWSVMGCEPYKNGSTDWDTVRDVDSVGPGNHVFRRVQIPTRLGAILKVKMGCPGHAQTCVTVDIPKATQQGAELVQWLSSLMVRALDLQLDGCEFNSRPRRCWGKLFAPTCLCRSQWFSDVMIGREAAASYAYQGSHCDVQPWARAAHPS